MQILSAYKQHYTYKETSVGLSWRK